MIRPQKRFWPRLTYIAIILALVLPLLTSCGGGKDNDGITPPPDGGDTGSVDVILDESTVTLDEKGGEVVLKDGTKLTVPAGALSGTATVGLKKLSYPQDFGEGTFAYDVTGLSGAASAVTLTFPAEKGLSAEEVNIVRYDTDKREAAEIPYTYDAAAGSVNVTIDPTNMATNSMSQTSATSSNAVLRVTEVAMGSMPHIVSPLYQGAWEAIRILFTPVESYVPNQRDQRMQMPYYQQVGGACWAADVMMMLRGYGVNSLRVHLGKVLSAGMGIGGTTDSDFGILAITPYLNGVLDYIVGEMGYAGMPTTGRHWRGFVDMQHMRWELLRQVESGHPVILLYPGHAVMVVGYLDYGDQWVLQDSKAAKPPDARDGGMYTIRPWSWIKERRSSPSQVMQILWLDTAPVAGRTLKTIGLPGGDETTGCPFGEFWFYQTNPRTGSDVPVAQLQFRPSKTDGYRWQNRGDDVEVIPDTATNLGLRFPLWNASSNVAQVAVQMEVFTGSNKLYSQRFNFTLPAASDNTTNVTEGTIDVPLEEIRRLALAGQDATQKIAMDVKLQEGSTFMDGFTVEATLSVRPLIRGLTPTSGRPGDELTVNGNSFGKTRSAKGAVTISGKPAEIVSWSESEITVKVPQGVASGEAPVVVTTGEQYSYESNAFLFTAEWGPTIGYLTPTKGPVGTTVTISGSGFGATKESSSVTFTQTVATTIVSWQDNEIKVKVPNGATTGPVVVKRDTLQSNPVNFTVDEVATVTGQIEKEYSFTSGWPSGDGEQVVTVSGPWALTGVGALLDFDSGQGASLDVAKDAQASLNVSVNVTLKESQQRTDWPWPYLGSYTILTYNDPELVAPQDISGPGLTCSISASDEQVTVDFAFSSDEPQINLQLVIEVPVVWVRYDQYGIELESGEDTFVFGAAYFKIDPA